MRPRCPDIKVFPQDIKPSDEFRGYHWKEDNKNTDTFCQVIINDEGIPLIWGKHPIEDPVEYFYRTPTREEETSWKQAQFNVLDFQNTLNLMGLHTDLYDVGDARHEMYNAWIDCDFIDQMLTLKDENFFILGIAPAPWAPPTFNSPIAFVCEEKDTGDRFWCHAEADWITNMREESEVLYKMMMGEL